VMINVMECGIDRTGDKIIEKVKLTVCSQFMKYLYDRYHMANAGET